jgi:two-component system response regulator FixJ
MSTNTGPVMVVDDDDAVRQSLQFALELEGLEVQAYGSGQQLLAKEHMPEKGCLVVDYYMPVMDGVELLNRLRLRKVELPAILITAKATGEIRQRAFRAGFRQVLEKPLEDSALIDGIRRLLADA